MGLQMPKAEEEFRDSEDDDPKGTTLDDFIKQIYNRKYQSVWTCTWDKISRAKPTSIFINRKDSCTRSW